MSIDVEDALRQELHEVAGRLPVPPLPALPAAPAREPRRWVTLVVAAVLVLFVAGVVAVAGPRGADEPDPAPPPPSPSPSPSPSGVAEIPTIAPQVPYVLDGRLFVDGQQVDGEWFSVDSGPHGWLGWRADGSFSWGRGPSAVNPIEALADVPPVISLDGVYVGELLENGRLSGFDTDPAGEGFGSVAVDLGDRQDGTQVTVRAVTDDGAVIAQGTETSVLWPTRVPGSELVDLTRTAPGQYVVGNTPAGLVVTDGVDGAPYLAEISEEGQITRLADLPAHDALEMSTGGSWLAYLPAGTLGGEVEAVSALTLSRRDGSESFTLTAPEQWDFRVGAWTWEDDDHLVAAVVGAAGERLVRCGAAERRCVLVTAP